MIEIKKIIKIYKSKKKNNHKALDNINLTLPDNGLVFIIGKSGSGKSTLLNLLGGLDNTTSGSIFVDGNEITKYKENELANYRNNHIGFIFQDYHLLDELTVYENIVLSLNLNKLEDNGLVFKALEKVGLEGYENRYPTELSGGERQRVAIARAIVKKPYVILADEPTGNLDNETGTQIVNLLKELSRDCLILIVSHNTIDTYKYADRIIKLSNGHIISDESRNIDYYDELTFVDNILYYPMDKTLTNIDIEVINKKSFDKIVGKSDKYIKTTNTNNERNIKVDKKNLSIKNIIKLCLTFLKSKVFRITASGFMISVIMVILALSQTIIAFDSSTIISEEAYKQNIGSMYFQKQIQEDKLSFLPNDNYKVEVDSKDIITFKESGYEDEILPVYNVTIASKIPYNFMGYNNTIFENNGFLRESLGTLIVNEDFLRTKFGDYEYVTKVDEFHPGGIIITDFMADSIIKNNNKYDDHQSLLGYYVSEKFNISLNYINGIIDTDYEEKYSELFNILNDGKNISKEQLYENEQFKNFTKDIYDKYGYCFSLNSCFVDDYQNTFSWYLPFTQKLMINEVMQWDISRKTLPYVIWGECEESNKLLGIGSYIYTYDAPIVPYGAKYMRVQYGGLQTPVTQNSNPIAYRLKENGKPIIVFSDGSSPDENLFKVNKSCWLNVDGSLHNQTSQPNAFVSDFIQIPEGTTINIFETYSVKNYAFCSFYDSNKNLIYSYDIDSRTPLKDGEINMNIDVYNEIFKTDWNISNVDQFVPHKITISQYRNDDVELKNQLTTIEVMVSSLIPTASQFSGDVAKKISQNQVFAIGLYFNGVNGIGNAIDLMDKLNYEYQFVELEAITTMTKAVDVFIPIFELVAIVLCAGIVFILISFSLKMIKDKIHDIGILKALGCKNSTIGIIFGLQLLLIAICTIILSTIGYFFFIDLANDVLIESLKVLAPSHIVLDLDFLTFKINVVGVNSLLVVILTIVSFIIPMLKIYNIKPVQIIKTKE